MQLSVVVAVTRAGRAIVPTLHSIGGSRSADDLEVIVVTSAAELARTQTLVDDSGATARVIVGEGLAGQRNAGVAAASGDVVAILDGGDLAGASWLGDALAASTRAGADTVVHPERVLAFGARTADWPQPASDAEHIRRLLPVVVPFASPIVAPRALLVRVPFPGTADGSVDAAWLASSFGAGVRHTTAPRTAAFVRTWDAAEPWRVPVGPSLPPIPWLRDGDVARHASLPPNGIRERAARGPRVVRVVGRGAPSVVRPWRTAARLVGGRLRGMSGFPEWFVSDWRAANLLEPLIPYPRSGSAARLERWGEPWAQRDRDAADAYWRFVGRLPTELDYLFVGPWVRMGGGDSVLLSYVDAVHRLDPSASVALLATEPVVSTRLDEVSPDVVTIEAREVVPLESDRELLVERTLPMLLAQYRPDVLHAINSTVAFDVIERYGDEIARDTRIFLSSFAIDRAADGERTSVMFLRRPGFLDPVKGVLVDSSTYVDTLVRHYGYPREKFVVQSSVIEVPLRSHAARDTADAGRPLTVLWVGRFDIPKRIDILARIAEAVRARGLPVELHFHGAEVMGDPNASAALEALAAAGAVRHPPFDGFTSLPLDEYDAYVLTSEWEGVPTSVLESMAAGIPVIAPLVGGVGEVLDATTGYPVDRFDDVEAYVDALRSLIDDPAQGAVRAASARERIERGFSRAHFDERLRSIPDYLRGA